MSNQLLDMNFSNSTLESMSLDIEKAFGEIEMAIHAAERAGVHKEKIAEEAIKSLGAGTNVEKMESNVGDVGIGHDLSNNSLNTQLMNDHPLLDWLLNTPFARALRATTTRGLGSLYKDVESGIWTLQLPYTVYTLPPVDTSGACCWVPMDVAKCAATAPIYMLCLKDCYKIMDKLMNQIRRAGGNDLTNYFMRPGESAFAARRRMAGLTMAYLTAKNVILGVTSAGTETLKPFHGLLEVMENPAVINIDGGDILAAFQNLACRMRVLDGNNQYVFATNPLTYEAINQAITPDIRGMLPANWTRSGDTIRFMGIRIITDKVMPVDLNLGLGEVWLLEGTSTGAWLATSLIPGPGFRTEQADHNDVPADGCASECYYYWNLGTVANNNPYKLAVISGIPLPANCADALGGLDNLINPDTLVPWY